MATTQQHTNITINPFLSAHNEKLQYNQYWYSPSTIDYMIDEIARECQNDPTKRIAFLSTPSLYFSFIKKFCHHSHQHHNEHDNDDHRVDTSNQHISSSSSSSHPSPYTSSQ